MNPIRRGVKSLVLDHIEKRELSATEVDRHFDSLMALARLGEGLFWLDRTIRDLERRATIDAAPEDVQLAVAGGILDQQPLGFLSCAFQWYAVSACNYAQLVGWLATGNTEESKQYVKRVLPRVVQYRNKVAAHFAITDPRRDNEADLAASVMTQVVYAHGRLCAASLSPIVKSGLQEITASSDLSWSLTLAHERLLPRYWPNGPPKAFQALKIAAKSTITLNMSWSDLVGDGA